jgi:hypothetical protein
VEPARYDGCASTDPLTFEASILELLMEIAHV